MDHHDWFTRLRAEDPVHWYDDGDGQGFWNLTKYDDVVMVNRDSALFSSQIGGTQVFSRRRAAEMGVDTDEAEAYAGRGVIMLEMDPPKHTRYRLLVNKGFTPRMIGLLNQALRTRATHIVDQVVENGQGRLRHRDRVGTSAAGDRRDHGRPAGRPHEAVRVVEQHDRRRRSRVPERRTAATRWSSCSPTPTTSPRCVEPTRATTSSPSC